MLYIVKVNGNAIGFSNIRDEAHIMAQQASEIRKDTPVYVFGKWVTVNREEVYARYFNGELVREW